MQSTSAILMMAIRLIGVIQLVLGVLFWTGNALNLLMLEMVLMVVLVISLWGMAGLAARAGVLTGLAILAVAWGIIIPVLSMVLPRLRLGELHWVLHVLHLLAVVGVLGLAELLAAGIRQRPMQSFAA